MKAWVTMGYFDDRGDGCVLELDAADGSVREVLRFQPDPHLVVPFKGFTGATWAAEPGRSDLLICGPTAVFRFSPIDLRCSGTLALPSFNDLHGVHVHDDLMYVVNTGLDCVDVFQTDGTFAGSHGFEAPWLVAERIAGRVPSREDWQRLQGRGWTGHDHTFAPTPATDAYYRETPGLPFHKRQQRDFVHPNHFTVVDGRPLVTSLVRRAVIDMWTWQPVMEVASPPHDGIWLDGAFRVTRVDGYMEASTLGDHDGSRTILDVSERTGVTGWCRGLHFDEEWMWVGFTQIRHRPGHMWQRDVPFTETSTAVVVLERETGDMVHVFDLTDDVRHSKVFTILEAA